MIPKNSQPQYQLKHQGDTLPLMKKMLDIMQNTETVPKNGENPEYAYVLERDVIKFIREKLIERYILMIPTVLKTSTRESQGTTISKVEMAFSFIDVETGSSITTYYQGEGEDPYDKGIYKAITGCLKYALLKTFLIPTGDDPENVEKSSQNLEDIISKEQARQLFAMGKGNRNGIEAILSKYGYKNTFEVQQKHLQPIISEIKAL